MAIPSAEQGLWGLSGWRVRCSSSHPKEGECCCGLKTQPKSQVPVSTCDQLANSARFDRRGRPLCGNRSDLRLPGRPSRITPHLPATKRLMEESGFISQSSALPELIEKGDQGSAHGDHVQAIGAAYDRDAREPGRPFSADLYEDRAARGAAASVKAPSGWPDPDDCPTVLR